MLALIFAAIISVVAAQGHGGHGDQGHQHAFLNHLRHMFEHVLDANQDGMVTVEEELNFYQQQDPNHDCKETYEDFKATRAFHSFHLTEVQLQTLFHFYDTRGDTQAADGFYTCEDVRYFFAVVDTDGDGFITLDEFLHASDPLTSSIAHLVPDASTTIPDMSSQMPDMTTQMPDPGTTV